MDKLLLAIILLALVSVGCSINSTAITGNGSPITRQFELADFSRIDIGSTFQAEVVQGETYSVSITADSNLFDYIQVRKNGSALGIHLDPLYRYWNLNALRAKVTMPNLDGITLSGASRANVQGFKSERELTVDVSGASRLDGNIEAGNSRIGASGASRVTLDGRGADASLDASGASQLNLDNFPVRRARVVLSGASKAAVNAQTQLDYDLTGASNLTYAGNPTFGTRQTSGASTARQK